MTAPHSAPASLARPCPFITFYSFKGGVGRSMAVINVAGILASRGFRVLVIDMDLEAPGISFLANEASPTDAGGQPGFVDFLLDAIDRGPDADLFRLAPDQALSRYSAPFRLPKPFRHHPGGSLHIMPAGRIDDDYPSRLERLDLPGLYRSGSGLALIKAFKEEVVQRSGLFDHVFIDSRTGFSDESGICTRDLADYLMVVSGLNDQNVKGTTRFLSALRASSTEHKPLQVIMSPVPNGEDALVDKREAAAQKAFSAAWGAKLQTDLQIPYHPQLALTEDPHIFRRHKGYLFEAYAQIERRLLAMLGETPKDLTEAAIAALKDKNFAAAAALLRRARLLADAPDWINDFIIALTATKPFPDMGEAADMFDLVIDNASPPILSSFLDVMGQRAWALSREHNDPDAADAMYKRALDAGPKHLGNLGNYANFLRLDRRDLDAADAMYKRALDADPNHADNLGKYANFLRLDRRDLDAADAMYKRALGADPMHAINLGNYAIFLHLDRKDLDAAEALYKRALDADPEHADHLGSYANFLRLDRKHLDAAEAMLKRALDADPKHANHLGDYATFLHLDRKDLEAAETMYKRALDAAPKDANNLGNYGRLCLETDRVTQGIEFIDRAIELLAADAPYALDVECWMYVYCCGMPARRFAALARLRRLIETYAINTEGWDFSGVIRQARRMEHPEGVWLHALAEVLAGRQPIAALDAWDAWRALADSSD